MSIHALCPNSPCVTKLFWRIPYTTIEACNEHSSHAFYTQHTPIQKRERFLVTSTKITSTIKHTLFSLIFQSPFISPCIPLLSTVKLSIIFIKVASSSTVYFISKNNKHTYITPKFHNRTIILQFFSTY
jgi:hypothetical protein